MSKWLYFYIDVFSFHNQFWFLAGCLVGLAQRIFQLIVTNLRHSKLCTFENSSNIQHEKRNFPKSSNPVVCGVK
jgi:hypothetical protein